MRILQINACHYHRGGSETVYFSTAQLLKNHGHIVAYFSTRDIRNDKNEFDKYFVSNGNVRNSSLLRKIQRSPSYLYNIKAAKNLEVLVKDFCPDIAHVHLFYADLSVSILKTLKKLNIPVVHTVHDYRLLCPVKNMIDNKRNICELCRDRHFMHCLKKKCSEGDFSQSAMVTMEAYFWKYLINPIDYIDHFVFVSDFSKNKHLEFSENYENRSSLIYNFTNSKLHNDLVIKGDYFLYFGRLSVEKGIEILLKAFSNGEKFKLKVAGTGPLSAYVEECAKVNNNIEYVGFKNGEDLYNLVRNSKFVIIPSVWYENNPMTIIESLSMGKPVIASNIGGIPELITDGENGYLFDTGDTQSLISTIERAAKISDSDYKLYSNACRKLATESFDPEIHYEKILNIYLNVIKKRLMENSTGN